MFDENFSFDTPRSPSLDSATGTTRDSSRSVSPCSAAGPFPQPRFSVTDLAVQFADQRLRQDSRIYYDSCEAYANTDNDDDWSIPSIETDDITALSRSRTFPQRPHSPSRRIQRQVNTRLLCTPSHRRDVAALVARMVETEEQCSVMTPVPEDEGYDSSDDTVVMPTARRASIATAKSRQDYRRSSDLNTTGACVSKSVRFRKDRNRRIRSSEKATSS